MLNIDKSYNEYERNDIKTIVNKVIRNIEKEFRTKIDVKTINVAPNIKNYNVNHGVGGIYDHTNKLIEASFDKYEVNNNYSENKLFFEISIYHELVHHVMKKKLSIYDNYFDDENKPIESLIDEFNAYYYSYKSVCDSLFAVKLDLENIIKNTINSFKKDIYDEGCYDLQEVVNKLAFIIASKKILLDKYNNDISEKEKNLINKLIFNNDSILSLNDFNSIRTELLEILDYYSIERNPKIH